MPIQSCSKDGKSGYRWGNSGACYTYSNEAGRKKAKQKAIIQGYAVEKSKERSNAEFCEQEQITQSELEEAITSLSLQEQVLFNLRNKEKPETD